MLKYLLLFLITEEFWCIGTSFSLDKPLKSINGLMMTSTDEQTSLLNQNINSVPTKGIIDYIGRTEKPGGVPRWSTHSVSFKPPTKKEQFSTRFALWRQLPWKKIKEKVVVRAKLSGSLPLESVQQRFSFGPKDLEPVSSLQDLNNLFTFGAYDPRVKGVFIELGGLSCGYAKLQELKRSMEFFKQSGKEIIGFSEVASAKELYLALSFSSFYIPPEGGLDLRGFSSSASFVREFFRKVGVEPQVQRIGKYKSFGDTFNRSEIAEAQREVISSLLTEASDFWVDAVAESTNTTAGEVRALWAEAGVKTPYDFREKGLISGVMYKDQVEAMVEAKFSQPKKVGFFGNMMGKNATEEIEIFTDFDMSKDFEKQPRRQFPVPVGGISDSNTTQSSNTTESSKKMINKNKKNPRKKPTIFAIPGQLYLRKMRKGASILKGLPVREVRAGPRIAVINAVGSIVSGESSSGGVGGRSVGSDSLTKLIRTAKRDPQVKAVVLRVDSPGGSALASDIMWRELRSLSKEKPVVASMVDVAASGGYYLSMACDQIVAEELTVTGSIGVVISKFNTEELNRRIGIKEETLSIGRYAELLSSSRGFTEDEQQYFDENAHRAYKSFVSKAAASRSMDYDSLHEVAQGRVWTGRQANERGLTDHVGGLWKALEIAANMSSYKNFSRSGNINIQTLRDLKATSGFPFGGATTKASGVLSSEQVCGPWAICGDEVVQTGLAGDCWAGSGEGLLSRLGLNSPLFSVLLKSSGVEAELSGLLGKRAGAVGVLEQMVEKLFSFLEV